MDGVSYDCWAIKRAVTGRAIEEHGSEYLNPQLYVALDTVAALLLPVIHLTVFGVSDPRITLRLSLSRRTTCIYMLHSEPFK